MAANVEKAQFNTQEEEGDNLKIKLGFSVVNQWKTRCLKVLIAFLVIIGLICMIFGIVWQVRNYKNLIFLNGNYTSLMTYFLALGAIMVFAGVCGIFCIVRKSHRALLLFTVTIGGLVILHIVLGIFSMSIRSEVELFASRGLEDGYTNYYLISDARDFMDWSQQKFKCCGERGTKDYKAGNYTHKSTKPPHQPTTARNQTTTAIVTTTTVFNTTTAAAPTTVANATTTYANTTTTAAPTTVANTTKTAAQTTVANATAAATTAAPTTKKALTSSSAPTTAAKINTTASDTIVNAAGGGFRIPGGKGLPESCCKHGSSGIPCIDRPADMYKHGCYKQLNHFVKKMLATIGAIAFCIGVIEIFGLIIALLNRDGVKNRASYEEVN